MTIVGVNGDSSPASVDGDTGAQDVQNGQDVVDSNERSIFTESSRRGRQGPCPTQPCTDPSEAGSSWENEFPPFHMRRTALSSNHRGYKGRCGLQSQARPSRGQAHPAPARSHSRAGPETLGTGALGEPCRPRGLAEPSVSLDTIIRKWFATACDCDRS